MLLRIPDTVRPIIITILSLIPSYFYPAIKICYVVVCGTCNYRPACVCAIVQLGYSLWELTPWIEIQQCHDAYRMVGPFPILWAAPLNLTN